MSAQNRPVSKVSNKNFIDNFDRIFGRTVAEKLEVMAAQDNKTSLLRARVDAMPIGEDLRPKDRVRRGLGSACVEENWDCRKKGGDV